MDALGDDLLCKPHDISRRAKSQSLELRDRILMGSAMNNANSMFKIQRQLFARSERVKGIDFHPVEPWILTTLYSGTIFPHKLEEIMLMYPPHRPCLYMVV